MKITKQKATIIGKQLGINFNVVSADTLKYAINVEMEHGKRYGTITNVTNDNLVTAARIALAHLIEFPDYYSELYKMESKLEKRWKGKRKPDIFGPAF
jgi:hypothetical protein